MNKIKLDMNLERIKKLIEKLESKNLDGFLIKKKENISYLSGFRGDDSLFIITPEKKFFITDSRYKEEAESTIKDTQIFITNPGENIYKVIRNICKANKIKRLAFESKEIPFSDYQRLMALLNSTKLFPMPELVERLREVKTEKEIEYIQDACRKAIKAMRYAREILKPGLREDQVAAEIECFIKRDCSGSPAFATIVASGSRSSMPHAVPLEKKIKRKEIVLIDLGVRCHEYVSDLTRLIFLGRINQNLRRLYKVVLSAQRAAIEHIRPGISASVLDKLARQILNKISLERYFVHSTGHGIGREVHERPIISQKSKSRIAPGMVFTIEPGVYIPGFGGIRIEDVVLVTEDGCRILTEEAPHFIA